MSGSLRTLGEMSCRPQTVSLPDGESVLETGTATGLGAPRLLVTAAPPEVLDRTYQMNIILKSEKT